MQAAGADLTLAAEGGDTHSMSTAHILRNTWWWRFP
jgi:hypothetical protein